MALVFLVNLLQRHISKVACLSEPLMSGVAYTEHNGSLWQVSSEAAETSCSFAWREKMCGRVHGELSQHQNMVSRVWISSMKSGHVCKGSNHSQLWRQSSCQLDLGVPTSPMVFKPQELYVPSLYICIPRRSKWSMQIIHFHFMFALSCNDDSGCD